jgi:hypothetical protein
MFATDTARVLLTAFVEIRNVNVHNGGIVNELFLSKVGKIDGFEFARGRQFHVDMDKLILLSDNAIRTALGIDQAVATKFGLQRKAHKLWSSPPSRTNGQ